MNYSNGNYYIRNFEFLYEGLEIVGAIYTNSSDTATYYYDKNHTGDVMAILYNPGNTVVY